MHLPDFVLLVIGTFSAIAAGLGAAVLALENRNFRVVRTLFWAAALSFGSRGIVWSQTSEGYSVLTQMAAAAVCAAIAAGGLVWGLHEIRLRAFPSTQSTPSHLENVAFPHNNQMGDVTNNTGVVTQGQSGNNISK